MLLALSEFPSSPSLTNAPRHFFSDLVAVLLVILTPLSGCSFLRGPVPVDVTDPTSACARLRTSYPSAHGLILFSDTSAKTTSIPWCFPGTAGFGVLGYNVNIPITDPGTFSLVLSDLVEWTC